MSPFYPGEKPLASWRSSLYRIGLPRDGEKLVISVTPRGGEMPNYTFPGRWAKSPYIGYIFGVVIYRGNTSLERSSGPIQEAPVSK